MAMELRRVGSLLVCALGLLACTAEPETHTYSREKLMDPETCKECHPKHYNEWAGSMHAYASADPVFRAMNARGQEQANLGDFCVKCHAPMAVREGATVDGRNLDTLPARLQGVTCYFCHNAVGVGAGELNNNPLELAHDTTMRGSIRDPVASPAHGSAYSRYHDRNLPESSAMCGACHDIVTPNNKVHLERTFAEYQEGLFSKPNGFETCQGCHMDPIKSVAAVAPGIPVVSREVHEHLWPATDIALTDFPQALAMRTAVEQCTLPNSIQINVIADASDLPGTFRVQLESIAGHNVPSGATQDRRMWLEVISYDAQGKEMVRNGVRQDNELENFPENGDVWTFHDRIYNAAGQEVHMFWEAAPSAKAPLGYLSGSLPVAKTVGAGPHTRENAYFLGMAPGLNSPARAVFRLRMRPMALEVLQDLVQSGHLDPSIPAKMPTFTMRAIEVVWGPSGDPRDYTKTDVTDKDCKRYACLLQGGTPESCGLTQ